MIAQKNSRTYAPAHMKTPAPRRSRKASLVVAAALVASLGGAGIFGLASNNGAVTPDVASAPQVVQVKDANASSDAVKQAQEAAKKAEEAKKAAEERAAQESIARAKAEQDAKAAQQKAAEERAAAEKAAQQKAAAEKAAAEKAAAEKAAAEKKASEAKEIQKAEEITEKSATYTADMCRDIALHVFDKDGQATNVKVGEFSFSGGASTYYVEFDKAGWHYTVRMNADEGTIVYGTSTDGNVEINYGSDGSVLGGLTSDGECLTRDEVLARMTGANKAEVQQVKENKAEEPGATYTAGQCRDLALSVFAWDGQATNVTVSGIAQGGGANCCYVEFDKAGQHYTVRVNADEGTIVYGSSTDGSVEISYDSDGSVLCGLTSDGDPLTQSEALSKMTGASKAEQPGATCTADQCRDLALAVFNGDGQATNVTVSGITQGGGASTCYVEFDKAGQHYTVRVNADEGTIVYGSSTDGARETTYDGNGNALTTIGM